METTQQNRRRFPRFSDRILAGTKITLQPCPPFYGDIVSGYLVDLSAGGMGILIPDLIPKKVFLKMTMTLPDGFPINSVITVRHISQQSQHSDFLHGVEFLNLSPEMMQRIDVMAREILRCNERTQQRMSEICVKDCLVSPVCKRPQRLVKNIQPVLKELTDASSEVSKPTPMRSPVQRPTTEEIENFFRNAA